jgi:hypothetical protein
VPMPTTGNHSPVAGTGFVINGSCHEAYPTRVFHRSRLVLMVATPPVIFSQ